MRRRRPQRSADFKKDLIDSGVFGFMRPPVMHWAPPLIITDEQINDTVDKIDAALYRADARRHVKSFGGFHTKCRDA